MQALFSFLAGLIFGVGLLVSGMGNPAKVLGFLDLAGPWDPSLALVMAGAIGVALAAFRIAGRRSASLFGGAMHLPTARELDRPLVLGSLAFGVGWGLAGYCPGPALMSLGTGAPKALVFVAAMLVGMALFEGFNRMSRKPDAAQALAVE